MPKKKVSLLCFFAGLLFAALLAGTGVALKYEPHFYRAAVVESGPQRKQDSIKFIGDFGQLITDLDHGRDDWQFKFTEAEINSFFQEDFVNYGEADKLHKIGISEPRAALDERRIRFAFRYGSGFWSTVVSYDLHVWAVPKEPNVVAVEIRSRRAGALPISCQSLLTELTEVAARHNIEVTPYRHEGHPVALMRFSANQSPPRSQLKCLRITPGQLCVAGSSGAVNRQAN